MGQIPAETAIFCSVDPFVGEADSLTNGSTEAENGTLMVFAPSTVLVQIMPVWLSACNIDDDDHHHKPVWPTWDVGVLSGV
jgi:hypothetical protein